MTQSGCPSLRWTGCERGPLQVWSPNRTPEKTSGTVPDVGLDLCRQEDSAAEAFELPRRELNDLVHALHVHEVPASRGAVVACSGWHEHHLLPAHAESNAHGSRWRDREYGGVPGDQD